MSAIRLRAVLGAIRKAAGPTALVLVSVVFSFVVAEAGYRAVRYLSVEREIVAALLAVSAGVDQSVYDAAAGYRYPPNRVWDDPERLVSWRTNEHGIIANDLDPSPYPEPKPPGEIRIAILGDSFTASNSNRVRWSDLLQVTLNESPAWRRFAGGRFTRVLNFGMDGTGIVQWPAAFEQIAKPFGPDLVIASYITDDILRRFLHRAGGAVLRDEAARARARSIMQGMSWTTLRHSGLIADTIGRHPRYTLAAALSADSANRFHTQAEAIAASIAAISELQRHHPRVLLMQIPLFQEMSLPDDNHLRWPRTSLLFRLDTRFRDEARKHGLEIVNLAAFNHVPPEQITPMYKLPIDTHFSDAGVRRYADWLARYLIGQASFWSERFSLVESKPSEAGLPRP